MSAHPTVNVGDFQNPLTTYKGAIYFVWIDSGKKIKIARKSPNGSVTESILWDEASDDPYHVNPSVGIDRDGYIHVAGNLHGNEWSYKVSSKPEDISSFEDRSSDRSACIPYAQDTEIRSDGYGHAEISYPHFVMDKVGRLFAIYRMRVDWSGWVPGIQSSAMARYDEETKQWTMLGGDDYVHGKKTDSEGHGRKTLIWNNSSDRPESGYQGYKTMVHVDNFNTIHLSWVYFTTDAGGKEPRNATHLAYMCTKDGGDTWLRADGSKISHFPVTIEDADIAWNVYPGSMYNISYVGAAADGSPIVSVDADYKSWFVRYVKGSGWQSPQRFSSGQTWMGRFWVTPSGNWITIGGSQLKRSKDNGVSWQSLGSIYSGYGMNAIVDPDHLAATGEVRFQSQGSGSSTIKVYTVKISDEIDFTAISKDFTGHQSSKAPPLYSKATLLVPWSNHVPAAKSHLYNLRGALIRSTGNRTQSAAGIRIIK